MTTKKSASAEVRTITSVNSAPKLCPAVDTVDLEMEKSGFVHLTVHTEKSLYTTSRDQQEDQRLCHQHCYMNPIPDKHLLRRMQ